MSAITINIEDKQYDELEAIAKEMNLVSVEALLLKIANDLRLAKVKKVDDAVSYVLSKNAELYKRLA